MSRKKQDPDRNLKLIVIITISLTYLVGMTVNFIWPDRQIDPNIGILMGAVVGYLLNQEIRNRKK